MLGPPLPTQPPLPARVVSVPMHGGQRTTVSFSDGDGGKTQVGFLALAPQWLLSSSLQLHHMGYFLGSFELFPRAFGRVSREGTCKGV